MAKKSVVCAILEKPQKSVGYALIVTLCIVLVESAFDQSRASNENIENHAKPFSLFWLAIECKH
jgi:hypothetical protein